MRKIISRGSIGVFSTFENHRAFAVAAAAALVAVVGFGCSPMVVRRNTPKLASGVLPASWYAGDSSCAGRPNFRVHAYNEDFYILRQAACTNYEKPFLYLVFGDERVLLLDTGAGKADVNGAVTGVIDAWLTRHHRGSIDLVVAHSHAHGDHVAGDPQFVGRPNTTLVGRDTTAVKTFFGITNWPEQVVQYDLGNRILDVIPIPGHQPASIALYDRRTGVLLSGDTFYPGRLYVRDTAAYARSVDRLVAFTANVPITHILGTHIEQSNVPFKDYPIGTVSQPNEHVLELTRTQLVQLDSVVRTMRGHFVRTLMADYTVWPQ
jgi:hydroxyacylglutathione hydrolase